jgi:predicted PurR-regulated permease PerM
VECLQIVPAGAYVQDGVRFGRTWLTFFGTVLVIAILYLAQAFFVPIAIAVLLTFLLTPVVNPLQRRIGRIAAVLVVVVLAFTALGVIGWATTRQLTLVIQELPAYRQNIRQKIRDVRDAGDGSVGAVKEAIEDIRKEIEPVAPAAPPQPVVVQGERVSGLWRFPAALGPVLQPLATAGLVIVLVIFMLLERQDLRDRLIRLFGHGQLTGATRALDEAAQRVSRYLLTQSLVNLTYGFGVGVGLWALGVPYPILWGFLATVLRFIPYVGPWVAAVAPLLVALAVLEGWTRPIMVAALFIGLELFTNLVLETIVYADAAGFSQVGLLVAVAFWTWLWGPFGLIIATPLTVCLAVLGKHIPGLELVPALISHEAALQPDVRLYQRLLAGDQDEAVEILEQHLKADTAGSLYDAIIIPALAHAECDRIEGRLSDEEAAAVVANASEIVEEVAASVAAAAAAEAQAEAVPEHERVRVLGHPARSEADALALRMLEHELGPGPLALEVGSRTVLTSELVELVRDHRYAAVCIADLPPAPPSRARHLAKRLRAARPDLKVVVGRFGPDSLQDEETTKALLHAGVDHVGTTLREMATELRRLATIAAPPESGDVATVQARA